MSAPELWAAADIGDLEAVSELLIKTSPAPVNEQDGDGRTAVHRAVSGGHVAVAWQLLQGGADVTIPDKRGRSALWDAVDCNSEVLVRMLAAWGGDPRGTADGQSLYQYAKAEGKTEVSRALMEMTFFHPGDLVELGSAPPEIIPGDSGKEYRVMYMLSRRGRLGQVYAVQYKPPGADDYLKGRCRALQMIPLSVHDRSPMTRGDFTKTQVSERVHRKGGRDKVLKVVDKFECSTPSAEFCCLITEGWETDLDSFTRGGSLGGSLAQLSSWAYQIARGLQQLQEEQVVHNAIALHHILVRGGGEEVCLTGCGSALILSFVRSIWGGLTEDARRDIAMAPEVRRTIEEDIFTPAQLRQKENQDKAAKLQVLLTKRLADSKQDMWAYGILLLRLLGLQDEHFPGKDEKSDTYCEMLLSAPQIRERFYSKACLRFKPATGELSGHEELVLRSIIDATLGCLSPTPGARLSAAQVIATLIPMDPIMAELGKFTRDSDLIAVNQDGSETAFAVPFGAGFFGAVYRVKLRRDNTPWVLKRIKDAQSADDMFSEIRLICRLQSDYVVRYFATVHEGPAGGACRGFLMEVMDEDLLAHLQRPQFKPAGGKPSAPQLHSAVCILSQVAHGLLHIHQHSPAIVHRDLHIRNVLIKDDKATGKVVAKITDFGCGRMKKLDSSSGSQTDYPGFVAITPPEATSHHAAHHPLLPSYDMYGFGLLVAQVVNRLHDHAYWEELNSGTRDVFRGEARQALGKADFLSPKVGESLANLIRDCQLPASGRATANTAVGILLESIEKLAPLTTKI